MRVLFNNLDLYFDEKIRLIKTLIKREKISEFPFKYKWKLQMLYFYCDKWIEICRIDNYPHNNKIASHVHKFGFKKVVWIDLSFDKAEKLIIDISQKIIELNFKK